MAGGIATGSAMRRRQRRLRQWHRHERMTVAMALAEATHHAAPRGPKTARAGVRPGVLEDPGPRRETEHEQHSALRGPKLPSPGVPSLAMPVLAGTAGEAVDRTALSYLLQQSLAATKEEEKEERKLVELEVKRKEAELQIAGRGDQGDGPATYRRLLFVDLYACSQCPAARRAQGVEGREEEEEEEEEEAEKEASEDFLRLWTSL